MGELLFVRRSALLFIRVSLPREIRLQTRSLGRNKGWQSVATNLNAQPRNWFCRSCGLGCEHWARSSITRKCLLISKLCELRASEVISVALNNMFFIDDLLPLFVLPAATGTRRSISMFQGKAMDNHIRGPIQQGLHPVSQF
jgi:hypothetical protein